MSLRDPVHCIVDDTTLTTNVGEIENWVSHGAVTLIIPLYTLERLHLLKKDASQIGQNARKAVKFLDRMTSGKLDLPNEPIIIQQPEQQYATWQEVEAHYNDGRAEALRDSASAQRKEQDEHMEPKEETAKSAKRSSSSANALSQILLDKLNFAPQPTVTSPGSTPPASPSCSEPQSSKASPEIKVATLNSSEKSPVPEALKILLNPVVWYVHEKANGQPRFFFLTNSADTQHLARDFQVPTKTIHQLRSMLGPDELAFERGHKKQRSTSSLPAPGEGETQTLFSYEDESDEEEVVFKPRGRGARGSSGRGGSLRNKAPSTRSPRLSFSTPAQTSNLKPQIPVEEIDPDSFDRGSFGRGSVPLANTGSIGNHVTTNQVHAPRGPSQRGNFAPTGPSRGLGNHRGGGRGSDRGHPRGRGGRLFVP